jgi:carbon starvation protein
VIVDAARVWVRVIRSRRPAPTTEVPFVQSHLSAPAGLFPGADDALAPAGAGAGTGRFTRETEREPTGGRR